MQQDSTLGKMWLVIPLQMDDFLKKLQGCVFYQDVIYLADNRLVGPLNFGTTVRKKLKYPNMIDKKQWKALEKEGGRKGINASDTKEVVPLGR